MRFKIAAILVGGAFAFLLGGAPMALAKSIHQQFSGEVSHLGSKTLAVKDTSGKNGKEMTFTLAPEAKIMQGSMATSLGELKVGERVKVGYTDQGSAHQANRIDVLPAKTAKALPPKTSNTKPTTSY